MGAQISHLASPVGIESTSLPTQAIALPTMPQIPVLLWRWCGQWRAAVRARGPAEIAAGSSSSTCQTMQAIARSSMFGEDQWLPASGPFPVLPLIQHRLIFHLPHLMINHLVRACSVPEINQEVSFTCSRFIISTC